MTATSIRESELQDVVQVSLVDCDVHPTPSIVEVAEYVPEPWRSRYFRGNPDELDVMSFVYQPPLHVLRQDATPPDGGLPGSDPGFLEDQLLRGAGIDIAILLCQFPRPKLGQPEFETALLTGLNSWLEATWLSEHNRHGRYRAAIRVCPDDVAGAVEEIEKWSGHPNFVDIYITPEGAGPFGHPRYFPVYDAAQRAGLPVSFHVSRAPGMRLLTPAGFPSYHLEIYPQWPLYFMGHLASFVFNGVFDAFPDLRVAAVEGGFTWVAPFMWRLDKYWEALGGQLSGARQRPSSYMRERVRFTTQPLEEPTPSAALLDMIEWMGGDELLMFSTDYPHYDFDDPAWILPRLPEPARRRICAQNAIEFFGLPATRSADYLDATQAGDSR